MPFEIGPCFESFLSLVCFIARLRFLLFKPLIILCIANLKFNLQIFLNHRFLLFPEQVFRTFNIRVPIISLISKSDWHPHRSLLRIYNTRYIRSLSYRCSLNIILWRIHFWSRFNQSINEIKLLDVHWLRSLIRLLNWVPTGYSRSSTLRKNLRIVFLH